MSPAQYTQGRLTFAQVWHMSRLGGSKLIGMLERPNGSRAIVCDKPLNRSFIIRGDDIARAYGDAAIANVKGGAA